MDSPQEEEIDFNQDNPSSPRDTIKDEEPKLTEYQQRIYHQAGFNEPIENIEMEAEDKKSWQYEMAVHKLRFKEKDFGIPLSHNKLQNFYTPICQPTPFVPPIQNDSYAQFYTNTRSMNLANVKYRVVWSKEKEAKERQDRKNAEERARRDRETKMIGLFGKLIEDPTPLLVGNQKKVKVIK